MKHIWTYNKINHYKLDLITVVMHFLLFKGNFQKGMKYDEIEHLLNDHREDLSCLLHQYPWRKEDPIEQDCYLHIKLKLQTQSM